MFPLHHFSSKEKNYTEQWIKNLPKYINQWIAFKEKMNAMEKHQAVEGRQMDLLLAKKATLSKKCVKCQEVQKYPSTSSEKDKQAKISISFLHRPKKAVRCQMPFVNSFENVFYIDLFVCAYELDNRIQCVGTEMASALKRAHKILFAICWLKLQLASWDREKKRGACPSHKLVRIINWTFAVWTFA